MESSQPNQLPPDVPSGFGLYKFSRQSIMFNIGALLLIGFINYGISFGLQLLLKRPGELISFFVTSLFGGSFVAIYLAGVRRQKITPDEALHIGFKLWLKMIGLNIVVTLALIISFVALIVPFFFVLPRVVLAKYYLVDKNMGVIEAYKASWHATKGHAGLIYAVILATIAMALLAITVIGIPFSIYFLIMYSAAYALIYEMLTDKSFALKLDEPVVN